MCISFVSNSSLITRVGGYSSEWVFGILCSEVIDGILLDIKISVEIMNFSPIGELVQKK